MIRGTPRATSTKRAGSFAFHAESRSESDKTDERKSTADADKTRPTVVDQAS